MLKEIEFGVKMPDRIRNNKSSTLAKRIWRNRALYLVLLPSLLYFAIFHYLPYFGLTMAFQNFSPAKGLFESSWVGLENFVRLFSLSDFYKVFANTLIINVYKLIFYFPMPVIFALLLNEVRHTLFKRTVQVVTIFPYFLSWVVFGGLALTFVIPGGPIAELLTNFGIDGSTVATNPRYFRAIIVASSVLKSFGFGSIIYLAALSNIDPCLYEASRLDGANRWKQMLYVTLPGIKSTIIIMFIFEMGYMMDAGFEQIFVMYNPPVYDVADIIDTYVYRTGLENAQYSLATALGMFKGVVAFILIATTNLIVKKMGETSLW